ncbi:hypothetical protein ACHWQZ_G010469 [Mnemiopsis leidyi]
MVSPSRSPYFFMTTMHATMTTRLYLKPPAQDKFMSPYVGNGGEGQGCIIGYVIACVWSRVFGHVCLVTCVWSPARIHVTCTSFPVSPPCY